MLTFIYGISKKIGLELFCKNLMLDQLTIKFLSQVSQFSQKKVNKKILFFFIIFFIWKFVLGRN